MIVTFLWPDKRLSPNARLHYRQLATVKKSARDDAMWTTKAQLPLQARQALAQGEDAIAMTISFYPPDARHRDDDNAIASFKATRDGLADALGVDDRRFRPVYYFCDPEKPGRVEVRFG